MLEWIQRKKESEARFGGKNKEEIFPLDIIVFGAFFLSQTNKPSHTQIHVFFYFILCYFNFIFIFLYYNNTTHTLSISKKQTKPLPLSGVPFFFVFGQPFNFFLFIHLGVSSKAYKIKLNPLLWCKNLIFSLFFSFL